MEQYEEITDRIENEVSEFLTKVNENDITSKSSEDIRSILSIISELESIGDVYYSISKNIQRKTEIEQNNKISNMSRRRNGGVIHKTTTSTLIIFSLIPTQGASPTKQNMQTIFSQINSTTSM